VGAVGIDVGPMDHSALAVPLVLAVHVDGLVQAGGRNPGGEVGVVCDQKRLVVGELDDQALVLAAGGVVGQEPGHRPAHQDLETGGLVLVGRRDGRDGRQLALQRAVDSLRGAGMPTGQAGRIGQGRRIATGDQRGQDQQGLDGQSHEGKVTLGCAATAFGSLRQCLIERF